MTKVDRDTEICVSLAQKSGNFGVRFHNHFYSKHNLNFIYKNLEISDLEFAVKGVRALRLRGCGVTSPFKEMCLKYVDSMDTHTAQIGAANTILRENENLIAFNTDWHAVAELLSEIPWIASADVLVLGAGGMARACLYAARTLKPKCLTVWSRNIEKSLLLKSVWPDLVVVESLDSTRFQIVINATPVPSSVGSPLVRSAKVVIDCPVTSDFLTVKNEFLSDGVNYFSGWDVTIRQAQRQFEIYTGLRLSMEEILQDRRYYQ